MIKLFGYGDKIRKNISENTIELLDKDDYRSAYDINRPISNLYEEIETVYKFLEAFGNYKLASSGVFAGSLTHEFNISSTDIRRVTLNGVGKTYAVLKPGIASVETGNNTDIIVNRPNIRLFERKLAEVLKLFYHDGSEGVWAKYNLATHTFKVKISKTIPPTTTPINFYYGCANQSQFDSVATTGVSSLELISSIYNDINFKDYFLNSIGTNIELLYLEEMFPITTTGIHYWNVVNGKIELNKTNSGFFIGSFNVTNVTTPTVTTIVNAHRKYGENILETITGNAVDSYKLDTAGGMDFNAAGGVDFSSDTFKITSSGGIFEIDTNGNIELTSSSGKKINLNGDTKIAGQLTLNPATPASNPPIVTNSSVKNINLNADSTDGVHINNTGAAGGELAIWNSATEIATSNALISTDGAFTANLDTNIPTQKAVKTALDLKINASEKAAVNGVATLGADGKVPTTQLPSYVDGVLEYTNLENFPVTGETGKIYVDKTTSKTYRWSGSVYIYITSGAVDSVAGKTGVVTLSKSDVGLSRVDNTTDAEKPVSTATQTALDLKSNIDSPVFTGTPTAPTASAGTNDTQIATTAFVKSGLDLKSDIDSPTFTGTPTAPTADAGTNTNQLATTAFVKSGLDLKSNIDSPAFTGTPTAPTAAAGTNTNQLATTAFVKAGLDLKSDIESPAFTGTPTAPTAASGANDTQIATTAFVKAGLDLKSNIASPVFTGTPKAPTAAAGTNTNQLATTAFVKAGLDLKINATEKAQANGVATLGADGKVPTTQLPSYVDGVLEYTNLAAFPVTGETGKIYVALDTSKTYRWSGSVYIYITSGAVDSVAGKTGVVTLVKSDVGLSNVDNTTDAAKPVSTATQTALDLKSDIDSPAFTGTPTAPTADAGTNTNQLATTAFVKSGLDLKSDIDSPTFTGTPTAPTADAGTNTNQLATTAFVKAGLDLKSNIDSPAFTGTPTAPTAAAGTNTNQLATTAFVKAGLDLKINASEKAAVNGVATLGADGKVPTAQIPAQISISGDAGSVDGVHINNTGAVLGELAVWNSATEIKTSNVLISTDGAFTASLDTNIPTQKAVKTALDLKINASEKARANGVATLGADGKVPATQLPSYVDDVLEFANFNTFPKPGETGKIYVALDTNKTYRWGGSSYTYITSGAVDSVAGKTGVVTLSKSDVGLSNVDNTTDAAKPISTATQTALNLKLNSSAAGTTGLGLLAAANAAAARTTLGLGNSAVLNVGNSAGTVCAGDDSRLSDERTPLAHTHNYAGSSTAGGSANSVANTLTRGTGLTGNNFNGSTATTWAVSYGSSAGTACQGNDYRLSDARTPVSHAHSFSTITNKPTTLAGYGITDAMSSTRITVSTSAPTPNDGVDGDVWFMV